MSGWIERILTIPSDLSGESWTIVLRVTPPTWALVLMGLLLMALGWASYVGLRGGRAARSALAVCRTLSLGLVLLLILGPMIEWPRIREIRALEDVWLLILATNHFIVLPVRGAPREALRFIQDKVRAARAA